MGRFFTSILVSALAVSIVSGEPLDTVRQGAQGDLDDALTRYAALQKEIMNEQIPLDRRLNEIDAELREKRSESERARRLRDNSSVDLNSLRDRVGKREEQINYVANLVADFGGRFERDIDLSEQQIYANANAAFLASMNEVVEEEEFSKGKKLLDQIHILTTAVDRFESLLGGQRFEGRAVVPGGSVESGTFVAVGPTYYFASNESPFAGLSMKSSTSALPPAAAIDEKSMATLQALAANGKGTVLIDASLGSALAIKAQEDTLWEHIQKGGIWVWPILLFALLAGLTSLFKFIEIFSVPMPETGIMHDILTALNEGDRNAALKIAQTVKGPAQRMLVDAVEHSEESKELIEEVMYERMLEVQPKLERMLPFIAVTAATAPLMGLLGTVTGMINTFDMIKVFGTGDAKQLSGGISEALITTEFGLVVAIPSLVMHALLNRRAQGLMARMERMAVAFVNGITRRS